MVELSESEEEYLESLYTCEKEDGLVKVGVLAKDLGVKEPSVVEMLKKLGENNLVKYERYSGAKLTKKGEKEASRVVRCHRLAERLLSDVLGHELSDVHDEACKFEHTISDVTADEIAEILGDPETCPHGQPIPPRDKLKELSEDLITLNEAEKGREYTVITIPEEMSVIRRLLSLGILPDSKVKVGEAPSLGAIMIRRGDDELALSQSVASQMLVKPHGKGRKRKRHRRTRRKS